MHEPPVTESEARSEGFELEDYQTEIIEVWPDNELAYLIFQQIGTRWRYPPMGGAPYGLDWLAVYPLMDRQALDNDEWNDLQTALMVMEGAAVKTMAEFAPKKSG